MEIFEHAQIELSFEISDVNDQCMRLTVLHDDGARHQFYDLAPGRFCHSWRQRFPGSVTIQVDGKGANDTLVDEQGQIIKDKFIQLIGLRVDGLGIDPNWLFHHIHLVRDDGKTVTSSYWGFNGRVVIDFDSHNSWIWLARAKGQL
jgi:hypothetical protein